MDYDLYIKHEEDRKKFATTPDVEKGEAKNEYSDRIVEPRKNTRDNVANTNESFNEFKLDFVPVNVYGEILTEGIEEEVCCICGEPIEGYGNNPYPVKEEGRCCDACNLKFVIPARLRAFYGDTDE